MSKTQLTLRAWLYGGTQLFRRSAHPFTSSVPTISQGYLSCKQEYTQDCAYLVTPRNPAAIVPLGLFFYMVVWFSLVFVCSSWLGRPGRPDQRGAPAGSGHSKIQLWSACLQWPVFTTKAPSTSQRRTQNLNPSVGLHDLIIISSQVCPEVCFLNLLGISQSNKVDSQHEQLQWGLIWV